MVEETGDAEGTGFFEKRLRKAEGGGALVSSCMAGQLAEARWEERGGAVASTHRLWGFDEHFTLPQLELVVVHVD